jgi:hypothetical protein
MAKNDYSHGDHMAQLGKVTGLLEAVSKMQNQLVKEQERLKILEQKHLLEKIKNEEE